MIVCASVEVSSESLKPCKIACKEGSITVAILEYVDTYMYSKSEPHHQRRVFRARGSDNFERNGHVVLQTCLANFLGFPKVCSQTTPLS